MCVCEREVEREREKCADSRLPREHLDELLKVKIVCVGGQVEGYPCFFSLSLPLLFFFIVRNLEIENRNRRKREGLLYSRKISRK